MWRIVKTFSGLYSGDDQVIGKPTTLQYALSGGVLKHLNK